MNKAVILTSGIGFGTYIPSVVFLHKLTSDNISVSLIVIEKLFTDDKKNKLYENQEAYHKSVQFAKAAMRIPLMQNNDNFDEKKVKALLNEWKAQSINTFIVFSGSWQRILQQYQEQYTDQKLHISCVHMDCILAPSWKNFEISCDNDFWPLGSENMDKQMDSCIMIDQTPPVLFDKREKRLVMHGGGWGVGIDKETIDILSQKGFKVDVISTENLVEFNNCARFFYTDRWQAWLDQKSMFPPLYSGNNKCNLNLKDTHYVYELIKNSIGIVSKPGGGTLLDSLSSATPVIFTPAIAKHEESNAKRWITLGFGITIDEWRKSNFSIDILQKCYENIYNYKIQMKNLCDVIEKWIYDI